MRLTLDQELASFNLHFEKTFSPRDIILKTELCVTTRFSNENKGVMITLLRLTYIMFAF